MAVENVPWFIGAEGVLHPAEAARAIAYAGANGSDGVISPTDLKIQATTTPNDRVTVAPGAVNLISRYPGASAQAYTGVVRSQSDIQIAPTSSAGGRSDLIVARVRDPQYGSVSGYNPSQPNDFDFFRVEVMQGVPSTIKRLADHSYPAMALARIDIPASTATITNAMITDLRYKSNKKVDIQVRTIFPGVDSNASKTGYAAWPPNSTAWFDVPFWATHATFTANIPGIEFTGTVRSTMGIRGAFGNLLDTDNTIVVQSAPGRVSHTHVSAIKLTGGFRGVSAGYRIEAYQTTGNGNYQLDYQSGLQITAYFTEDVE